MNYDSHLEAINIKRESCRTGACSDCPAMQIDPLSRETRQLRARSSSPVRLSERSKDRLRTNVSRRLFSSKRARQTDLSCAGIANQLDPGCDRQDVPSRPTAAISDSLTQRVNHPVESPNPRNTVRGQGTDAWVAARKQNTARRSSRISSISGRRPCCGSPANQSWPWQSAMPSLGAPSSNTSHRRPH